MIRGWTNYQYYQTNTKTLPYSCSIITDFTNDVKVPLTGNDDELWKPNWKTTLLDAWASKFYW